LGKTILILPDSHTVPGHNNRRFDWFGKLILDIRPDIVVDIGDFFDMPSLSSYESASKKVLDGRSYAKDIAAGIDAQERIKHPLRISKRKLPRFIRCLGNHENRITKALLADPMLMGTVGLEDLESDYFGWEEYSFLDRVTIENIQFTHYFPSGIMGRPISGENVAKQLIHKNMCSCVQGHSHLLDFATRASVSGGKTLGLVVGCYVEETLAWADPVSYLWNPGICILSNVSHGSGDFAHISLKSLRDTYEETQ